MRFVLTLVILAGLSSTSLRGDIFLSSSGDADSARSASSLNVGINELASLFVFADSPSALFIQSFSMDVLSDPAGVVEVADDSVSFSGNVATWLIRNGNQSIVNDDTGLLLDNVGAANNANPVELTPDVPVLMFSFDVIGTDFGSTALTLGPGSAGVPIADENLETIPNFLSTASFNVNVVPEPSASVALGLVGLVLGARRGRRRLAKPV